MTVQNEDEKFENLESNFFSFESVLSSDKTDPDQKFITANFSKLNLQVVCNAAT